MNYSKLGLLIICRINSKRLNNKIFKKNKWQNFIRNSVDKNFRKIQK